jgi:hypothetical protein
VQARPECLDLGVEEGPVVQRGAVQFSLAEPAPQVEVLDVVER